jgi:hypothetical protein
MNPMAIRGRRRCFLLPAGRGLQLLLVAALVTPARAADLEAEPIRYSTATASNAITRLQERLDAGQAQLSYDGQFGYLPSVLRELRIPQSSQMLVFSKTSLQRHRIAPRTPRALYYNDAVYVGFCQRGNVMEVSAADPKLGTVFYTLDQKAAAKPRFVRQNDTCLLCHASSQNQGFPGHLARSVYCDAVGLPILSMGSHHIDQCSPLQERWGGWYVTGLSGQQGHLGNLILKDERQPEQVDTTAGRNVTDLGERIRPANYLTPHSDIVALMVLEHQAEMHNRLTRANLLTRAAVYEEAEINKALGQPADSRSASFHSRIKSAGEPLVKYLLFSGEARLTEPVQGTSSFTEEFPRSGLRDSHGRSLRDFDLQRRLFKYPCSYLIYSTAFDALPVPIKDYVLKRVWEVLTGRDKTEDFAHLSAAERRAILEILEATKMNLPEYWKKR